MRRNVSCVCCCWKAEQSSSRERDRKGYAKEPRHEGRLERGVSDGERNGVHRNVSVSRPTNRRLNRQCVGSWTRRTDETTADNFLASIGSSRRRELLRYMLPSSKAGGKCCTGARVSENCGRCGDTLPNTRHSHQTNPRCTNTSRPPPYHDHPRTLESSSYIMACTRGRTCRP